MPNIEKVVSSGNGISRSITTSGVGSSNISCSENYFNTGVAQIYSDQGNYEVYQKDFHLGCNGNAINQINGDNCITIGGRNELRYEGSNYKIVGDADTYFYHVQERFDEINAEFNAYRSGFGDDRNEVDPSKLLPDLSFNTADAANAVLNQTDNNVKYPEKPKRGNFLENLVANVKWVGEVAKVQAESNLSLQRLQAEAAKLEVPFTKLKNLKDSDIDNLNCDEKSKEALKQFKEGSPSISGIIKLPGAALNALMSKIGHDGKNNQTFNKDVAYEIYLKGDERRMKILNMM